MWGRVAICAVAFAITWGLYAFVPMYVSGYDSMAELSGLDMAIFIPVMLVVGTLVSIAVFELEIVNGLMHYALYFVVTFVLAWLAGTPLSAPLSGSTAAPATSVTQPTSPAPSLAPGTAPPAAAPTQPNQTVPNLLQ